MAGKLLKAEPLVELDRVIVDRVHDHGKHAD